MFKYMHILWMFKQQWGKCFKFFSLYVAVEKFTEHTFSLSTYI